MIKSDDIIFIDKVLTHYHKHGRHDLPWRKNISAYRVLVSEIMLQQTQVGRVHSKYLEWIRKYPNLKSLAKSSLHDVLILWRGLGYQRRAKSLLSISREYKCVPVEFNNLLLLPGVGVYTASAIMAFAYNRFSHPVLETNIRTALIEHFHLNKNKVSDDSLYADLLRLQENERVKSIGARGWYYALMDFGSYLKSKNISHNTKSTRYGTQSKYKGSFRELRAKVLFAITNSEVLPKDKRLSEVLLELEKEGFIIAKKKSEGYQIC